MKSSFAPIIAAGIVLSLFVPVASVLAQGGQQYNTTNAPRAIPVDERTMQPIQINTNSQAYGAMYGTRQGGSPSISTSAGASRATSCAASSGLTNFVKQQIGSFTSSIMGSEVPVGENVIRGKETGNMSTAYISWDSMGYCMVNAIIEAIGAATVNWINSGFQGNPVFVDNPEQFFADIADIQAGMFLGEISNGFLCSPIKNIVKLNVATRYNNSINSGNQRQCTFTGVAGNIEKFSAGESFSWADWVSYTQTSANNPMGATFNAQLELDKRIAQSIGVQSDLLSWGRGFLSFRDPETNKLQSPGAVIEGQINQRLFNGEDRLKVADEFDEIVDALVNQLVKIAISEATQNR